MRWEIRLAGTGGQGLILASIILASACSHEGKNVLQTQNYGPESRGGSSISEVIIDTEEIYYPKVSVPNVMLLLSQQAVKNFDYNTLEVNGIMIVDSTLNVPKIENVIEMHKLPIINTAKEVIGKSIVTNMVALGAIVRATNIVNKEALSIAMKNHVPAGTENLNQWAIDCGYQLIEDSIYA